MAAGMAGGTAIVIRSRLMSTIVSVPSPDCTRIGSVARFARIAVAAMMPTNFRPSV